MAEQEKWRLDKRLTAMMIEDMLFDPILAAKIILRMKIPPHQQLRMMQMWQTHYTQDDSGFSSGKSTTHAMIIALRCILIPGRIAGIVSGTFRQGQLVFQNFDRWYGNSPIFRYCVKHERGQKRLIHGSAAYEIFFRGGSLARALPPNFANDSKNLQSERWHDGHFDEWLLFSLPALTKTLIGRVTAYNEFSDCPIRQNHIHLSGTPGFVHDEPYKLTKKVQKNIAAGSLDYAQFSCNYRHTPRTPIWKGLVDRKTIFTMQTMNPPAIVRSEVDGIWQQDSLTFYPSSFIKACRLPHKIKFISGRQYSSETFVGAYDVARGGRDATGDADDFSMSVFEVGDSPIPRHVYTARRHHVSAEQMAGIVQTVHSKFGLSLIGYDPGGGGLFVRDELRKEKLIIGDKLTRVTPIIEPNDNTGVFGQPILIPIQRGFPYVNQMWGGMGADSVLINRIHREMSAAIANGQIALAPTWEGWENVGKEWDADTKRDWLAEHYTGLSELELQKAEMDLAVCQLIKVDVMKNRQTGMPLLDKYNMYSFGSKYKKDSAYGLIYTYFIFSIFKFIMGGTGMLGMRSAEPAVSVIAI